MQDARNKRVGKWVGNARFFRGNSAYLIDSARNGLRREDTQARCTSCKDEQKDKPMAGLQLIWDMEKDGNRWSGGKLLDPDSSRVVNCRLETDEGGKVLKVRGSIAFLSKTQSWSRVE